MTNRNTFYSARRVSELVGEPLNRVANICAELQIPKNSSGGFVIDSPAFAAIANHLRANITAEIKQTKAELARVENALAVEAAGAVDEIIKTVRLAHAGGVSGEAAQIVRQLDSLLEGRKLSRTGTPAASDRKGIFALVENGQLKRAMQLHAQLLEVLK